MSLTYSLDIETDSGYDAIGEPVRNALEKDLAGLNATGLAPNAIITATLKLTLTTGLVAHGYDSFGEPLRARLEGLLADLAAHGIERGCLAVKITYNP